MLVCTYYILIVIMNQCCRISIIQEFLSSIYRRLLPGPWHSFRVICLLVYNSLIIIHSQLLFNCCCRSKIGRYELFLYSTLHISQNCSSWQRRDNPQQGTDTRASRRLLFASSTAYFYLAIFPHGLRGEPEGLHRGLLLRAPNDRLRRGHRQPARPRLSPPP